MSKQKVDTRYHLFLPIHFLFSNEQGSGDKESKKGRMVDALAHGGDEGRDKLR